MQLLAATAVLLLSATAVAQLDSEASPPPPPGKACQPKGGDKLSVATCSAEQAISQEWVAPASGAKAAEIHLKITYVEGLCIDAAAYFYGCLAAFLPLTKKSG